LQAVVQRMIRHYIGCFFQGKTADSGARGPRNVRTQRYSLQQVLAHIDGRRQQYEADLLELLRIPSVSADPAYAPSVQQAAEWVRDALSRLGLTAELIPTGGHPIVYAESPPVPGAPIALV
jgi:hypothetical protein